MAARQCLVTGGAGFIGSHLVEQLLNDGWRVRVLDDLSTGKLANLAAVLPRIEWLQGSITDEKIARTATAGCEVVFHLAALPSVARSLADPLTTHHVCATGTLQILDAARRAGVRRLIYAASSSAYGGTPGALRQETDPLALSRRMPLPSWRASNIARLSPRSTAWRRSGCDSSMSSARGRTPPVLTPASLRCSPRHCWRGAVPACRATGCNRVISPTSPTRCKRCGVPSMRRPVRGRSTTSATARRPRCLTWSLGSTRSSAAPSCRSTLPPGPATCGTPRRTSRAHGASWAMNRP